ncbi:MAG TPA: 50S ribosomal protein L23 [Pyrinomonadaceae bacterium]|nr:50S ribosomal protein L23 [Pyrinomonadaceae bacterium]
MKAKTVWEILKSPVITEKAVIAKDEALDNEAVAQVLTFRVNEDADKLEIKRAVEEIFNVKVTAVRTVNYQGKMKRRGRHEGRRPSWKKAFVTLEKGATVEYGEAI